MRSKLLFALLFCLSLATQALATVSITEIKSMEDVRTLFHSPPGKKRWIVFDFDNTLGEPDHPEQLASEQWLYAHLKFETARLSQPDPDIFRHLLTTDYLLAHRLIDMKAVEPCTLEYIACSRSSGAKVFAITARSTHLIPATVRQLEKLNIEFDNFAPELIASITFPRTSQEVVYHHGVFYVSDISKGGVFAALLQRIGSQELPQEVLYFDDKLQHVTTMSEAILHHNTTRDPTQAIVFQGFHYRYLDEKVASFVYDSQRHSRDQLESLAIK